MVKMLPDFKKLERKKKVLIASFLIIFVLFLSPRLVFAQLEDLFSLHCGWFDPICSALETLAGVLIAFFVLLVFGIPLILSALFAGIMCLILGWIISPAFISLKFTNNAFVNAGLSITRGFSNLGFIVFLVAIGLATALRIEEYKAKKTLPLLIIVALLINFSPVFCGIIIDASNIVMNFFLERIVGIEGFMNIINQTTGSLVNLFVESGFKIGAVIASTAVILVLIIFNFFAGFIFILFSALFIMRYIMLWILVILSPIAFVSYILPVTRHGKTLLSWRNWWEQLVAWAIIGIIAGFFLYLGFLMIAMINNNPRYFTCLPGDTNPDGTPKCGSGLGLMNNVVPYLIPLVLLWIAYRETKKTSAMFAGDIISATEKVTKGAVMAGAMVAGGAAISAIRARPEVARVEERFRKGLERAPVVGRMVGGPGAYEASKKKATEKEMKTLEGRDSDALREITNSRAMTINDRRRQAAAATILAKRNKLSGIELIETKAQDWQTYGADMGEIFDRRPDLIPLTIDPRTGNYRTQNDVNRALGRISPGELRRKIQPESLDDEGVVAGLSFEQVEEIGRRGSAAQKQALARLRQDAVRFRRVIDEWDRVITEAVNARAAGLDTEAERWEAESRRIEGTVHELYYNPNFQVP